MPGGVSSNADSGAAATQAKAEGRLTANQVYSLATQAGFSTELAHTMVAISWDESGFQQNIVNSIGCVGLWQINPVHFKETAFTANGWNTTTLKEGHVNARAAKVIYDAQGLNAWTTYKHGLSTTALNYARNAQDPATAPDYTKGNPNSRGFPNPLNGIKDTVTGAVNQLAGTLARVGLNLGGITLAIVLLILGVIILLRAPVNKIASKASPVGAVASLASKVG